MGDMTRHLGIVFVEFFLMTEEEKAELPEQMRAKLEKSFALGHGCPEGVVEEARKIYEDSGKTELVLFEDIRDVVKCTSAKGIVDMISKLSDKFVSEAIELMEDMIKQMTLDFTGPIGLTPKSTAVKKWYKANKACESEDAKLSMTVYGPGSAYELNAGATEEEEPCDADCLIERKMKQKQMEGQ